MSRTDTVHMPCSTLVGRADLLRCLDYYSAEELAEAGPLLGFVVREEKPQPENRAVIRGSLPPLSGHATAIPTSAEPVIQFLRVKQRKLIAEGEQGLNFPDWANNPAPYTDDDLRADQSVQELPPLPLSPWKREWPFLRAACGKKVETSAIDYDRLIKMIASRRVLRTIPRKKMLGWTHSCQVLLDLDFRLFPFWGDMRRVAEELAAMRHKSGLQVLTFDSERLTDCRDYFDRKQRSFSYALPEPGSAVLVLSDLGLYADDEALRQRWSLLGKRLIGLGIKPVALLPCPPRLWPDDICRYWYPVYWDRGVRLPDSASKIVRAPKGVVRPTDAVARAEELLAALAPAVLVEPALMRAVRARAPGQRMDVGVEGEVWNHPHVKACTLGFAVDPGQRQHYQERFRELSQKTQNLVFEQSKRHHAYLPKVIQFEETLNRHFLTSGAEQPADKFLKKLFDALESVEFKEQVGLISYLDRMYERLDEERWTGNEKAVSLWLKLHMSDMQQGKVVPIPNGIDLGRFRWLFNKYRRAARYVLVQQGPELRIDTEKKASESETGFPLVRFETVLPAVQLVVAGESRRIPVGYRVSSSPLPETKSFSLIMESSETALEKITKPVWATGIGREGADLYVTLSDQRTLHWFNPGRYAVKLKGRDAVIDIENGFWWDEADFFDWQQNTFGNLDWADDVGIDVYGVYAHFSVGKVKQRLRWIWPGTFMMGSPEREQERLNNETQHEVTLSEGFWLAETACHQALWQTVVGENPSRFKGEQRPVEMVSWEDCQRFIQAINEKRPGLNLRLPTEAEWEYACRAGTTTPFSFGENVTPEQVNYNGKQTVVVKSMPCNGWGLFEMHGNVYEWCQDWYREYPSGPVVDPTGSETGSARVLRGGGWVAYARICRSAFRYYSVPDYRTLNYGFRLARGQKKQEAGSGPGEGWPAEERSDRWSTPSEERGGSGGGLGSKVSKIWRKIKGGQ